MGCGKSKPAVATVDNAVVLSRKKSRSASKNLREIERSKCDHVDAGAAGNKPTHNDNGDEAYVVVKREKENGDNSSSFKLSQKEMDGSSEVLENGKSGGDGGADKNDRNGSPRKSNGDVASGVEGKKKEKENADGSSNASSAVVQEINDDDEIKAEVIPRESQAGEGSNEREVDGLDHCEKENAEVTFISNEKNESEEHSGEKVESDGGSHEIPGEDSVPVAEDVKAGDDAGEGREKGEETEEIPNAAGGVNGDVKKEMTTDADATREDN